MAKKSIDLLPCSHRRRQIVKERVRLWALILVVAVGVVAFDYHSEWKACQADVQTLQAEKRRVASVAKQKRELAEWTQQLAAIEEARISSLVPASADHMFNLLGIVSGSARDSQGQLWIDELKMTCDTTSTANGSCKVSMKGKALDKLVIVKFAATLRETGVFTRVELKPPKKPDGNSPIRDYVVECLR